MKIFNVHERALNKPLDGLVAFIDNLSGERDTLWPYEKWPPMQFDSPLGVGAAGGHGPVGYSVTEYIPGRRVVFQFNGSRMTAGLDGRHFFELIPRREHILLRHVVDAECDLRNWLMWHFIIGPLHDALLEDGLDKAENALNEGSVKTSSWGLRVRLLRWIIRRKEVKS